MAIPTRLDILNGKVFQDMQDAQQNFINAWAQFQILAGALAGAGLDTETGVFAPPVGSPYGSAATDIKGYVSAVEQAVAAAGLDALNASRQEVETARGGEPNLNARLDKITINAQSGLPSQTGQSGKVLKTNGITSSWGKSDLGADELFIIQTMGA